MRILFPESNQLLPRQSGGIRQNMPILGIGSEFFIH
jgi:hypothetical protein